MIAPVRSSSIASITTAYNAAHRLPRQIESLFAQSRVLDEIIVVDNGSTDGTETLLRQRYPQVTRLKMPTNLGAAGAWSAGLEYAALQKKHDWIWAFDDDSVPDTAALQGLLSATETATPDNGRTGMVAVLPVHRPSGAYYPPLLWRKGFHKPAAEMLQRGVWFADLAIVSGLMVSREVVEQIGLPRADFFMDFFDFEYCLRARSQGYSIAVVNGVQLSHEVGDARQIRLPGYSALWPNHAPWREYYMSRNLIYVAWWLHPSRTAKWAACCHLLRHASGSVLFGSEKLACVLKMLQGFGDGRAARLGIRFRPDGDSLAPEARPVA
jgi:GT2 family glycosyltransferase